MENGFLKNFLKRIKLNESTISMVLGALVIIVIGALIFNYFKGVDKTEEVEFQPEKGEVALVEEEGILVPENLPATHVVAAGEDLWKIAEQYYDSGYNWVDIVSENNLANPDRLLVGQELSIPRTAVIRVETASGFGPAIEGGSYTVEKTDNLWKIAVRAYGDGYQWVKIAQANNLTDPDNIHPGNVLTLPR